MITFHKRSPILDRIDDEEKRTLVAAWMKDEAMGVIAFVVIIVCLLLALRNGP